MVLYNLSDEYKEADSDTQRSAELVYESLKNLGYETEIRGITKADVDEPKRIKADLVFNLVEWAGLDYVYGVKVINNLEKAGLVYTGSNAWGYALCCDKVAMKNAMGKFGILTPRWQVFGKSQDIKLNAKLKFPVIVKPVYEHCAIGVSQTSVCDNAKSLTLKANELIRTYKQPVLVEEFIQGDEAHVTILEKSGEPWVLPPAMIRWQKRKGFWPILTYESKWVDGNWEDKMSVIEAEELTPEIERLARLCYLKLGGRGYPRCDMRVAGDKVYVLEINNNPGLDFDPSSGITVSAEAAGLNFEQLIENIVKEAYDSPIV